MERVSFSYNHDTYRAVRVGSHLYIGIDDICRTLGITAKAQSRKIQHNGYGFQRADGRIYIQSSNLIQWLKTMQAGRSNAARTGIISMLIAGMLGAASKAAASDLTPPAVPAPVALTARFGSVVEVPFEGSSIFAVERDDGEYVVVSRVCNILGIDAEAQRKFLLRQRWAKPWTSILAVQLPGERQSRNVFMLNRSRFAMWMATINQDLVDESFLPLLNKYQCEAADVLANHFDKRPQLIGGANSGGWQMVLNYLQKNDARMDRLEQRLEAGNIAVDRPSLVIPQVAKSDSRSMDGINSLLREKGFDVSGGETIVREIAAALGLIDDPKYGFWNAVADQTSSVIDENWRFFHNAVAAIMPHAETYLSARGRGVRKSVAYANTLRNLRRIGVGRATHLSRNANNSRTNGSNGHAQTNGPQLRTPA